MKYIQLTVSIIILLLLNYAIFYVVPNQFLEAKGFTEMQRVVLNRKIYLILLMLLSIFTYRKYIYQNKVIKDSVKAISFSIVASFLIFYIVELFFTFKTKSHAVGYSYAGKLWNIKYWNPINASGFRDEAVQYNPNKKTIFFIGDSFTEGHGIENIADRYSDIIKKSLTNYNIYNLGVNGLGTQKEIESLTLAPIKPNIVFWQYFSNDIDELLPKYGYKYEFHAYNDINIIIQKIVKGSFFFNYIYWELHHKDAQEYMNALINGIKNKALINEHLQNIDSVINYCSTNNIKLVFIGFPLFVVDEKDAFNTHAKFMLDYVASKNVEVVNVDSLTKKLKTEEKVVNNFDPHASKLVNKKIADFILKTIF